MSLALGWPGARAEFCRTDGAAEAEVEGFRQDLGPFVVAAETTRMPMVFTDAKAHGNSIIFANDSFLSLTGYDREQVLGQRFNFLMADGSDAKVLTLVEAAFAGSSDSDAEINYRRKDGREFWAATFVTPVRDERGGVVQHFVSFVDLKHKHEQWRRRENTFISMSLIGLRSKPFRSTRQATRRAVAAVSELS